jgi:hypothetical protein
MKKFIIVLKLTLWLYGKGAKKIKNLILGLNYCSDKNSIEKTFFLSPRINWKSLTRR